MLTSIRHTRSLLHSSRSFRHSQGFRKKTTSVRTTFKKTSAPLKLSRRICASNRLWQLYAENVLLSAAYLQLRSYSLHFQRYYNVVNHATTQKQSCLSGYVFDWYLADPGSIHAVAIRVNGHVRKKSNFYWGHTQSLGAHPVAWGTRSPLRNTCACGQETVQRQMASSVDYRYAISVYNTRTANFHHNFAQIICIWIACIMNTTSKSAELVDTQNQTRWRQHFEIRQITSTNQTIHADIHRQCA